MNQSELKALFHYDELTGLFTRIKTTCNSAIKGSSPKSMNKDGYLQVRIHYKMHTQHRLAWLYIHGEWPDGDIDHINHCRTDNRASNLRVVDKSTNNKNLSKRSSNTSGVTGVWWHKQISRWCAEIMVDGSKKRLGCYKDINQARIARKNAEIEFGFHPNHGR